MQQGEEVLKQKWEGEVTAGFEVWPGALGAVGVFRWQGRADHKDHKRLLPSVQCSLPLAKRHTLTKEGRRKEGR